MKKVLFTVAIFATYVACAKPAQLKQSKATTEAKPEKQSWLARQKQNLFGHSQPSPRVSWRQKGEISAPGKKELSGLHSYEAQYASYPRPGEGYTIYKKANRIEIRGRKGEVEIIELPKERQAREQKLTEIAQKYPKLSRSEMRD